MTLFRFGGLQLKVLLVVIQDIISYSAGASGKKLIISLTSMTNFMLTGKVNSVICPLL